MAEDLALKRALTGISIAEATARGGKFVAVKYRLPENELTDQTFPMIVIEHSNSSEDTDRAHRGQVQLDYTPEGATPLDPNDETVSGYWTQYPIPYNMDYRVVVYSRKMLELMPVIAALAQVDRIPARFGSLYVPENGTARRLDLLGGPEITSQDDNDGKRLFRADYSVRVSSELIYSEISAYQTVTDVNVADVQVVMGSIDAAYIAALNDSYVNTEDIEQDVL